jgi:ribosomal protein S18 acetylase RimI-like enzyme
MKAGFPDFKIREAEKKDFNAIVSILQLISPYYPTAEASVTLCEKFFGQTNVHSLVAEVENNVVGFGCILLERKIRGGIAAHIEDIAVKGEYQGYGIGKRLLKGLINICPDAYKLTLVCTEENIGFYKSLGFTRGHIEMRLIRLSKETGTA